MFITRTEAAEGMPDKTTWSIAGLGLAVNTSAAPDTSATSNGLKLGSFTMKRPTLRQEMAMLPLGK